ncbi:TetR family transcriptional regulator [Nocardioides albertanoniae]|uniref:TetR family transcriptional regulator n=1 Tax=Nocardioides albertanoniae TaxID=1175486 RepID=A0A543A1M8_9ACTN|nr:TetR family transcriptional regulator [Nocardioides albertanoniae]TQL66489.1 TetR family transcriptional regulator [Nocardioides albertanoniae]
MERTLTTEARRAQIVRAAIETIAEVGYPKASFARITARAGLSSPRMISYHFADKHDLLRQIVLDIFTEAAAFMTPRIEADETATGRLRTYVEANLDFLREHPVEIAALTELGPHLRTTVGEGYSGTDAQDFSVSHLATMLAAGQEAGEFRDFDTRSMAVIIRASIDAAAQRVRDGSDVDLDTYTREAVMVVDLAVRKEA